MPGTKAGGIAAAKTMKQIYGEDYYAVIGAEGGRNGRTGGFATDKVGPDGLTGRERASIVGTKGGKISKRKANNEKKI